MFKDIFDVKNQQKLSRNCFWIYFLFYKINTKELQNEYIILGKQINSFFKSFLTD